MADPTVLGGLAVAHLWQSVALAAVLAGALIFGRRLSGATRYGLSAAAFLACLALPLATLLPGEAMIRSLLTSLDAPVSLKAAGAAPAIASVESVSPAASTVVQDGFQMARESVTGLEGPEGAWANWALNVGERVARTAATSQAAGANTVPEAATPAFTLPTLNLPKLPDLTLPLILIWIAGAAFLLARTARDLVAVEKLVANAQTIDLPPSLQRRMKGVRVAVSAVAPGPMAAGLLRPCVVLPESATAQLNSPGMAALLEHERAHIERRDMAAALAQRVVLALLWWSPALHWISRRIDEERELACDETAVERTGDARAFARSLTTQAENQLWARAPRLAVGAIGPRSQFGRRIRRLIDQATSGAAGGGYSGRLAFSGLALAVVLAVFVTPRIVAQPPEAPEEASTLAGAPEAGIADRGWTLARFSPQAPPAPPAPPSSPSRLQGEPLFPVVPPVAPLPPAPPLPPEFDAEMHALEREIAALTREITASVGAELELAFADMPSGFGQELAGLELELAGLGVELGALGAEIAAMVSSELARELPMAMREVRIAINDPAVREDVRAALEEAREELRRELGPEFRAELRAAMDEARREIAHATAQRKEALQEARDALAEARDEMAAEARARGDASRERADEARARADAARERGQR